ncbi:MAG TPA: chloride channel protein, partial [Oceanicaulis sp.]|nr:chloride channel protein [Oceanicaulis sp.]
MSTAVTPPPLSPLDKLLRYLKNSFADGRSPALWLLALVVGVVAGYAAIGLRLAIQSVQLVAFGEFSERLASTASTLPPIMVILAPVAGGCVVALLLYVGLKTNWLPEVRAEG